MVCVRRRSAVRGNRIYISRIQKRMFLLAFATAFTAAFTQTIAVLVDNVIVCTFYGETEIAAVILAGPFFYLLEIPAAGLAAGLQTVCAKDLGSGAVDRVNRQFNQLFFLSAIVLTFLTAASFLFVPKMAVLFGARGKTAALQPYAVNYLYGLSFEILPYVLFCIMTPIVIMDNGGKLISIASICGCITDIVFDLLSVRFGWGLFGIGLASSLSAAVYFLAAMLHFLKRNRVIRLRPVRIRLRELKEIFISAAPKAAFSLANALRSAFLITLVAVTGGVVGTCVLSIHEAVTYTISILATGVAGAVGILTGICCGEKNGEELEGIGILAHRWTLFLSGGTAIVLAVCARPLSAALTESGAAEELLVFALHCVIIMVPFSILANARISYLQAVGKIRAAQRMAIASNLLFPLVMASLLAVPFGIRGIFMAFPAAQVMTLAASLLAHIIKTGKGFPSGADYLEVDDSFNAAPGDVISYPVETVEDCALASEQTVLFCRGHKLDARKGAMAGLCVEELTTNAAEHGRRPGQDIRTADIRIVIDAGDVIIRARDNGSPFNLLDFAGRLEAEEKEQNNTGLKILLHTAKSVSYYRTYGINTTIIKV